MKQEMSLYTQNDKLVWKTLFERQKENLKGKACPEYLLALDEMKDVLNAETIPNFNEIDKWFENRTAWKIEVVPGLIPVDDFFELLAQKKFCSSTWLRKMEQLDYLEEPDMFHDIFGHIPLLSNALFSDFMQKFGKLGVAAKGDDEQILKLQRLYWFTIEFGMIGSDDPKIYGAGICSSFGETNRSINKTISKVQYELEKVVNSEFRTDIVQEYYFCVDSLNQLLDSLKEFNEQVNINNLSHELGN
jgi:phenylalanine-4-hydroxylase